MCQAVSCVRKDVYFLGVFSCCFDELETFGCAFFSRIFAKKQRASACVRQSKLVWGSKSRHFGLVRCTTERLPSFLELFAFVEAFHTSCTGFFNNQILTLIENFFKFRFFFFRWNISVICPVIVSKLAITVFTSLPFQTLWPNWFNFFCH